MAKVFYIVERNPDDTQGWFFSNQRKAQEKGLEEVEGFEFGHEEIENEETGSWYHSGTINSNAGFLFWMEDGDFNIEAMDSDTAKGKVESGEIDENSAGAFFPAKLKAGFGECYIGRATEHTNGLWSFEGEDLYEKKQKQTTMKYLQLFEQFVNERFNSKRAEKELKAMGFKSADGSDGEISVETERMDNPFGHDAAFTFFWNGTDVWAEAEDGSYVEQTQEIETVEQFVDCIQFGEGWA